jgi:hypothetical protein
VLGITRALYHIGRQVVAVDFILTIHYFAVIY